MDYLTFIAIFFYLVTFSLVSLFFFRQNPKIEKYSTAFIFLTFFIHTIIIINRTVTLGAIPFFSTKDALLVFSWCLILILLYFELFYNELSLRFFILPIVISIFILSLRFSSNNEILNEEISTVLELHIIFSLLSYSFFTISFISALMHIFLFKEIKNKSIGFFYKRFPSLEHLDRINVATAAIGFIALTFGLISGFIWLKQSSKMFFYDIKVYCSISIWLVYFIMLHVRGYSGQKGNKLAIISIVGYIAILVNFILIGYFFSPGHSY